jgi:glycosyltransferase involved in cell wall biosynthesis
MDPVARGLKGALFEMHRRALLPWIVSRADRILVSSRDYAVTCALSQIPGALDPVEIHPFGVDLDRFHPDHDTELRGLLAIPEGIPVMLFVGALDPAHHFKGLPVLLEALEALSGKWHALIIGEGSLRASFMGELERKPYGERVHFVGAVPDEDLPRYYRAADIHVFPSTERAEAFGLVALEAAASGIPSIASDLPGVRSVVLDGETGLLVPPSDATALRHSLELLLVHTELRERLGLSARKRAEAEFAWDPLVSRLEKTYADVVGSQGRRVAGAQEP